MHPVIFLLVGLIQRNRSSDQRMFFRCQRASGEKMSEETFVFVLLTSVSKRIQDFSVWNKVGLRQFYLFTHGRVSSTADQKLLLTFQE